MNENTPTFISSRFGSTRELLSERVSIKDIDGFLIGVADRLTECLKQTPELSGWQITYRNILERDENPDGCNTFFVVQKVDVDSQRAPVFSYVNEKP